MSRASIYVLDYEEIAKARCELDVKQDVHFHIKWMCHRNATYLYPRDGVHQISTASDLTVEEVSSAIWHELTHAKQYETHGEAFGDLYDAQLQAVGLKSSDVNTYSKIPEAYKDIPFEVEARASEEKYKGWLLAKPTTPQKKRSIKVASTELLHEIAEQLLPKE